MYILALTALRSNEAIHSSLGKSGFHFHFLLFHMPPAFSVANLNPNLHDVVIYVPASTLQFILHNTVKSTCT